MVRYRTLTSFHFALYILILICLKRETVLRDNDTDTAVTIVWQKTFSNHQANSPTAITRSKNFEERLHQSSHGGTKNCSFPWRDLPPNTWFLGPTQVHNPNDISTGSAILAQPVVMSNRHTQTAPSSTDGLLHGRTPHQCTVCIQCSVITTTATMTNSSWPRVFVVQVRDCGSPEPQRVQLCAVPAATPPDHTHRPVTNFSQKTTKQDTNCCCCCCTTTPV